MSDGRDDVKLSEREQQVFDVLTWEPMRAGQIASAAGFKTISPRETAAKYAIQLVAKGLATRHGTRSFPRWALSTPPIPEPLPAVHSPHD